VSNTKYRFCCWPLFFLRSGKKCRVLTALRDNYFNCSYLYLMLNSFVVLLLPALFPAFWRQRREDSIKSAVQLKLTIIFGIEFDSQFYFIFFCYSDLTDKCQDGYWRPNLKYVEESSCSPVWCTIPPLVRETEESHEILSDYSGITTVVRTAHLLIQVSRMSQLARYQWSNYKFLLLLYLPICCMLVDVGLHDLNIKSL